MRLYIVSILIFLLGQSLAQSQVSAVLIRGFPVVNTYVGAACGWSAPRRASLIANAGKDKRSVLAELSLRLWF